MLVGWLMLVGDDGTPVNFGTSCSCASGPPAFPDAWRPFDLSSVAAPRGISRWTRDDLARAFPCCVTLQPAATGRESKLAVRYSAVLDDAAPLQGFMQTVLELPSFSFNNR